MGEHRNFKFGGQVDSKSQPTDDKSSLKPASMVTLHDPI